MAANDEVLSIGVDVDIQAALKQMQKFQREMKQAMGKLAKGSESAGKAAVKKSKTAIKLTNEERDAVEDLGYAYDKEAKVIAALEKQKETASKSEKDAIEDQISLMKKMIVTQKKTIFNPKIAAKSAKESAKEFGSSLKDSWGSFASKDLKGSLEGATKVFGWGLKMSLKGGAAAFSASGKGLGKYGAGLMERGAARGGIASGKGLGKYGAGLMERGAARGGIGGGGMAVAGKAMKAVGGVFAKMGPMLNMLTKLGPIVSTLSTVILSVVKLFVDAEAQAKAFNKEVLASASTVEYLGQAGGDVNLAFGALDATMKEVREAAYDLDNMDWGITSDDFKASLNVLNQEGVALNRLEQEARNAGKTMREFTSDIVHTGVAYSRGLGVPLQDINQLQGEMMNDLGMSAQETRLSFGQMARAASESGIAANKFFSIIRGVSQDLSLYNTRMEDAVKMLKMLGKVMNPREAAKFMQTAMQGLKNMGRQERLRMTLLAGSGKMANLVNRDIKKKQEGLAQTVAKHGQMSAEEALKTIQSGGKEEIAKMLAGVADGARGAVQEGLIDLDIQKTRAKKGTFGVSGAAANLGPAGALEAYRAAIGRFGGKGSLADSAGNIGAEMMAENLGISQEQLDQMIKFEKAMDMERASLKNIFEKQARGDTLTAEESARIQKAQQEGIASSADVDKAGYDQIFNSLDESTKKQHEDAGKVENYAKKQADLTSSLLDKLSVLVDFVMNQLYNVFIDIWETMTKIPGIGMGDKEREVKRQAFLSKDAGLQKAIQSATDKAGNFDINKFDKVNKSGVASEVNKALDTYLKASQTKGASAKHSEEVFKGADLIFSQIEAAMGKDTERWGQALSSAGVSDDKAEAIKQSIAGGTSARDALKQSGLDPETMTNVYRKAMWSADADKLSMMTPGLKQASGLTTRAATGKDGEIDKTQDLSESTAKAVEDTAERTKDVIDNTAPLKSKHTVYVRFTKSFLQGDFANTLDKSFLEQLRIALFEYYQYSGIEDRDKVAEYLNDNNMSAADFAEFAGTMAQKGQTVNKALGISAGDGEDAPKNAAGGYVYGVSDKGLAMVRAAAGEGLASVGPGERIMPANAGKGGTSGGTNININVDGIGGNDLARMIRAKVIDGIAEYKRRERFA